MHIAHLAAHGTITSRGAERKSRKTKPLPCRQRTPVAIIAPARSFRGYGGIETPMFLVLLTSKEHRPPFDAKRKKLRMAKPQNGSCGGMEHEEARKMTATMCAVMERHGARGTG